jgi:hypothetical protein
MNPDQMRTIEHELGSLGIGDPVTDEGLTVFPLYRKTPPGELGYTF